MPMDSRIIGDFDLGDLIGGDDDLGDLIGGDELGRRHRFKQKRVAHLARRLGLEVQPRGAAAAAARSQQLQAINRESYETGDPLTAGHYVADPGQRELYLPFSATSSLAVAVGQQASLTAVVQRPMQFKRLILDAIDSVTLGDVLNTVAVSGFLIGVQPVFNASGVAPARAFAFNTVGNHLVTPVARVGVTVTLNLQRIATGANAATVSGYLVGVSADT